MGQRMFEETPHFYQQPFSPPSLTCPQSDYLGTSTNMCGMDEDVFLF